MESDTLAIYVWCGWCDWSTTVEDEKEVEAMKKAKNAGLDHRHGMTYRAPQDKLMDGDSS